MEESKTEERKITLVSGEGKGFRVTKDVALMSGTVSSMLEGHDYSKEIEVPLLNVSSEILEIVISFCVHHVKSPMSEIDKPLKSATMSENVDEWDAKFIDDQTQNVIFGLILAANYMNIKSLLDLSCAKVSSLIKGKTPEEIRRTFNIKNDFGTEEEKKMREENEWCVESISS
jgi:S-phase kinase-associated protein 1